MNKVILLSNNRWQIEVNGTRGPAAKWNQPAFWPNSRNPDVIAVDPTQESLGFYVIKDAERGVVFLDESL